MKNGSPIADPGCAGGFAEASRRLPMEFNFRRPAVFFNSQPATCNLQP
jgi:hypothetical protein